MKSRDTDPQVLFASIQSVYKRAKELGFFDLLLIDETDIQRLIDDGFLSLLRSKAGKEKIDLAGLRTRQGDYLTSDTEEAVNKNEVTEKAVGYELAPPRAKRTVWYWYGGNVERHGP